MYKNIEKRKIFSDPFQLVSMCYLSNQRGKSDHRFAKISRRQIKLLTVVFAVPFFIRFHIEKKKCSRQTDSVSLFGFDASFRHVRSILAHYWQRSNFKEHFKGPTVDFK
jgi:hypothetical protein